MVGVCYGNWGWGVVFFDFDNDGDLDLIYINGFDDLEVIDIDFFYYM